MAAAVSVRLNSLPLTYPPFERYHDAILQQWCEHARALIVNQPELDFHLHMVSTIASAEEVHEGLEGHYHHRDQMWLWGPPTWQAKAHLSSFLLGFQSVLAAQDSQVTLEICAPLAEGAAIAAIFRRHFLQAATTLNPREEGPWAIVHFRAGSINSRKSMITPFLPRIVT